MITFNDGRKKSNVYNVSENVSVFILATKIVPAEYGVKSLLLQYKRYNTMRLKNSNVINSTLTSTLQPTEQMFIYIDYNFTTTGTFNVNASAINETLIDSRNLTMTIT